MSEVNSDYTFGYLTTLLWVIVFGWVAIRQTRSSQTIGLLVCYLGNIALNHIFTQMIYQLSPITSYNEQSKAGYEITAFSAFGMIMAIGLHDLLFPIEIRVDPAVSQTRAAKLLVASTVLISTGMIMFLINLTGILSIIPSTTAISSSAINCLLSGLCIRWYALSRTNRQKSGRLWVLAGFMYPVFTVLGQGFIGFGVTAMMSLCSFVFVRAKKINGLMILSPIILWLALSLWVTYAQGRVQIRQEVWSGSDILARVEAVFDSVIRNWSFLTIDNRDHLENLTRLNQNILLSSAVDNLDTGMIEFGNGDTLADATLAVIPRIVWPDKPFFGGGGNVVTRFTGITFAESTSVGIGQIMELYCNFGRFGAFAGIALITFLLCVLDRIGADGLLREHGSLGRFCIAFLCGNAIINVIGNFTETFPSLIGAYVFGYLVSMVISHAVAKIQPMVPIQPSTA